MGAACGCCMNNRKVEGLEEYYIDLDLEGRTIYDYYLRKTTKVVNGKWSLDNYDSLPNSSRKEERKVASLHDHIYRIGNSETYGPRNFNLKKKSNEQSSDEDRSKMLPCCAVPVYYPGEKITGNIRLRISEEFNFKEMSVHFLGKALNNFEIRKGKRIEKYTSFETYIADYLLLDKEQNLGILSPGEYSFPFEFQIPLNLDAFSLPTLHESLPNHYETPKEYCNLCYKLVANLGFGKKNNKGGIISYQGIWITNKLNVASIQNGLKPITRLIEQKTGILNDGKISLIVNLEKQAFVIGRNIPIFIKIDNQSSDAIKTIEAKFVLERILIGKEGGELSRKYETEPHTTEKILSKELRQFNLSLPMVFKDSYIDENLIPPSSWSCSIIEIYYELVITVKRRFYQADIKLDLPISLCTFDSTDSELKSYIHH